MCAPAGSVQEYNNFVSHFKIVAKGPAWIREFEPDFGDSDFC